MAGINVGPGQGFLGRMAGQMPGMINSAAQQFGDPSMRKTVAGSASLLGKNKMRTKPKMPQSPPVTTGMGNMPMPGQEVNIQAPGLQQPIDTGMMGMKPELMGNPYAGIFNSSPGYGRSGNTGIAGGLFNRPPGFERPNMGSGGIDIGGLFGAYNRLNNPATRY